MPYKKVTKKKAAKRRRRVVRGRGVGAENGERKGATVPMWAAMVALLGTAIVLGRKGR